MRKDVSQRMQLVSGIQRPEKTRSDGMTCFARSLPSIRYLTSFCHKICTRVISLILYLFHYIKIFFSFNLLLFKP